MDDVNQSSPQSSPALNPAPPPTLDNPSEQNPPSANKTNWLKWVVLTVFVALLSSAGTYFVLQSQKSPPSPAEVSTKTGPTPTPDPTTNWKTYTNTKYGFSIKYPSDWYAWNPSRNIPPSEANLIYITFTPPPNVPVGGNPGGMFVRIRDDRGLSKDAKDYVNSVILPEQQPTLKANIKIALANLGNIDAVVVDGIGHPTDSFSPIIGAYILRDASSKQVIELLWDLDSNEKDKKLFDQILSTFKFTQ